MTSEKKEAKKVSKNVEQDEAAEETKVSKKSKKVAEVTEEAEEKPSKKAKKASKETEETALAETEEAPEAEVLPQINKKEAEKIRMRLNKNKEQMNVAAFALAKDLYAVHVDGLFIAWDYDSFQDFVEQELSISRRYAYYLVELHEFFVVKKQFDQKMITYQLPGAESAEEVSILDVIKKLGWTKAVELMKVITPKNAKKWLDKAFANSVKDITEEIKALTAGTEDNAEEVSDSKSSKSAKYEEGEEDEEGRKIMSFSFSPAEEKIVKKALKLAKSLSGSDVPSNQLRAMAEEYVNTADYTGGDGDIDAFESKFSDILGRSVITLDPEDVDSVEGAAKKFQEVTEYKVIVVNPSKDGYEVIFGDKKLVKELFSTEEAEEEEEDDGDSDDE